MGILVPILICLVLSAFFSASEMAFVSCNKIRLKRFVSEKRKGAALVDQFHRNPKRFLASVLTGNNLVNVSVAALTAYAFKTWLGIESELLVTAVVAPFLIVFAETVPKDYGRQRADDLVYQWAPYMNFFYRLFRPLTGSILLLTDRVLKTFGVHERKSPFVSREEFHYLINESAKQGIIGEHEKRLVDTILNFERIQVEEVMTPLAHVSQIEITEKVGDLKEIARKTGSLFVVVYEEIPSIIVGVIYVFDTLFETDNQRALSHYLRAPLFVYKEESAEKAFLKLQKSHQSFAVALDELREAVGVVSIDNLLAY